MAYEHQKAVNLAADRILKIIDLALDEVDNSQQILELSSSALEAFGALAGALSAEEKEQFKAKVFIKLAARLINFGVDKWLPDSES